MNNVKIAADLRLLAEAFETPAEAAPQPGASSEPQKRGRGRPVKGEDSSVPAPTASTAPAATQAVTPDDPFATPAEPAPTATLDDVRKALTALRAAATQEKALAVLKKAGEADNITDLKPALYGQVVAAVNVELRILDAAKQPPAPEPDDPFAAPSSGSPPAKPLTIEDVKAEIVAAQKRTSTGTVQKVVMDFGGKASDPSTGKEGPSLKALPPENFQKTIDALKALPATK